MFKFIIYSITILVAISLYAYYFLENLDQQQQIDVSKYQGLCIGGKDPKTLSQDQILKEFIKGPCSPTILVPGLLQTSLAIEISCHDLKRNYPTIFKDCGWNTCKSSFLGKRPNKSYTIWISELFDQMSIMMLGSSSKCFGDLIALSNYKKKGIKMTWRGNTDRFKKTDQCGRNSVMDLADSSILGISDCQFKGFSSLINVLESMGYQSGITYQTIPYDFRKSIKQLKTDIVIKQSLINLQKISGKKSVIIGFSYGNLHTWNALNKLDYDLKNNLVQQYIAISPPFMGSISGIRTQLSGGNKEMEGPWSIGMNYYSQKKYLDSSQGFFDLFPRPISDKLNKQWIYDSINLKNLQSKNDQGIQNFIFENQKIFLNNDTDVFIKIENETFINNQQDYIKLFDKYFDIPFYSNKYLKNIIPEFNELKNPDVNLTILYGKFNKKTIKSLEYNINPKQFRSHETIKYPDIDYYQYGDGTITAESMLMPGLKWAKEFDDKQSKNQVKFVEICSDKQNIYSAENNVQSNFGGIECQQMHDDYDLRHSCIINDPYVVDFVHQIILKGEYSILKQEDIDRIDYNYINNLNLNCPNLIENDEF